MRGLALVFCATALAACGGNGGDGEARACADVGFTPQSDDIAVHIRAQGLSCADARRFVRASEGRPGDSFRGFTCTRRVVTADELPHTNWRCLSGDRVIRWRRY